MAQKVQVLLVDDLDGGEATETVSFGLDGSSFEIDLSSANADKIRKELALYIEHARKVSAPTGAVARVLGRAASGARKSGTGRSSAVTTSTSVGAFPLRSFPSTKPRTKPALTTQANHAGGVLSVVSRNDGPPDRLRPEGPRK